MKCRANSVFSKVQLLVGGTGGHSIRILAVALALLCSPLGLTRADAALEPGKAHREATAAVVQLMEHYHYKRVAVDDELSGQIFERYLDSLDPQKSFFLQSDIDDFEDYRTGFDDVLRHARLEPVFDIFNRFRLATEDRAEFAKGLLQKEFDFTLDEKYAFDREDMHWMPSKNAMNELWRKRVKNDVLSLRLTEMADEQIIVTLQKRYERMRSRVAQLNTNDVFQIFINAYTLSVEPHTSYFSPRSSEEFKIRMSLSLEGIGAALQTEDEYTVVRQIIAGGPAALSALLNVDDRIVGVGNEESEIVDVVSWPLGDVVDLIRGPKGSTVRLKVLRGAAPAGTPPVVISLKRDTIKLEEQAAKSAIIETSVSGKARRFGVIDLPTFYLDSTGRAKGLADYRSTTRDVRQLLDELATEEGGIDGVIIDLRGNGGGALVEATELAGIFIESGPVVQIRNSDGRINLEEDEDQSVSYTGPLAVLVDRNSASASEIFAAAIQDYNRGVVLGEPTFGKGTVQTVVPLDREGLLGQLKLTIAQFFRINGDGQQFRGVVPDIVFPTAIDSDAQGERGLENALSWAEVPAADYKVWADQKQDYAPAREKHQSRYVENPSFDLLIEELKSQRVLRSQHQVSLMESVRKKELLARQDNREERTELYRAAFGLSHTGRDADREDHFDSDILLQEAANVLSDILDG